MSTDIRKSSKKRKSEQADQDSETDQKSSSSRNSSSSTIPTEKPTPFPNASTTDKNSRTLPIIPENPYDHIRHCIVQNDGTHENLIRLIGLKSLFAKQLPKMPKDYIVRLVFDRRHKSLAVLSDDALHKGGDDEIIGGICYRPYEEMRFAEIAFCAVNGMHQVKGYGTKLMNLLKRHAVTEGIDYFITYADNYAIGYFKKQGFTKVITMPKSRYHGLIKDYDGANMMECYIHPSIDYTRIPEMVAAQRAFILQQIRTVSKSDKVVYPPLGNNWKPDDSATYASSSRGNEAAARAMAIPGILEAGWALQDLLASTKAAKDSDRKKNHLKSELLGIVRKTEDQQFTWPFREPVDTAEVKDYLEIIKDPIDLATIEKRIEKGDWYKSKQMLYTDLMRMVENCKMYNDQTSPYYECAVSLEKYLDSLFPELQ